MKTILNLVLFTFICLFFSCSQREVLIKENGTAIVNITLFEQSNDEIDKMDSVTVSNDSLKILFAENYDHPSIQNLKIEDYQTSTNISFSMTEIDSLGMFLDPLFGIVAKTKLTNRYFEMIGPKGDMDDEEDVCGCTNALTFQLLLTFEKTISKVKTKNTYIKQIDDHQVLIDTSIGEINFNREKNKVKIYFER